MSHWKKYDGRDWLRSMWTGVWILVMMWILAAIMIWRAPLAERFWLEVTASIVTATVLVTPFVVWAILIRKREQYPLGLPPLSHFWSELKWHVQIWWMWEVTGWPFKRRCPQCAGDGTYVSEAQARYGDYDGDNTCPMCRGTKFIKRQ